MPSTQPCCLVNRTGGTLNMCLSKITTEPKWTHYAFTYSPVFVLMFALPVLLMVDTLRFVSQQLSYDSPNELKVDSFAVSPIHDAPSQVDERGARGQAGENNTEKVSSSDRDNVQDTSNWSFSLLATRLKNFWLLNKVSIKFLIFMNIFSFLYLVADLYALYNVNTDITIKNAIRCLLGNSSKSDVNSGE